MSCPCGMGPLEYLRSKRLAPSARAARAILRATVSGEPTTSAPSSTSATNRALVTGGQPLSRPMRPNMVA